MNNKPKYNPNKHHRRSIRLKGYDYSQAGLYFITICCQHRIWRFGEVINGEMLLNELGEIAYNEWIKLTERFPNFELDVFQIMPNHMHGIIVLNNVGGNPCGCPKWCNWGRGKPSPNSIVNCSYSNSFIIEKGIVGATLAVAQNDADASNDSIGAGASPARTVL